MSDVTSNFMHLGAPCASAAQSPGLQIAVVSFPTRELLIRRRRTRFPGGGAYLS